MAFLGDWRSKEQIHAERAANEAKQLGYKNYNEMTKTLLPQIKEMATTNSPYYQTQRANAMGDMTALSRVGGNMLGRQIGAQGLQPGSSGYQNALANYYTQFAVKQSTALNQLQGLEEERKMNAMNQYYNMTQPDRNALDGVQYNNGFWDKMKDVASLYGTITGMSGQGGASGGVPTGSASRGNMNSTGMQSLGTPRQIPMTQLEQGADSFGGMPSIAQTRMPSYIDDNYFDTRQPNEPAGINSGLFR